jgi:hypothetical protein
MPKKDPDFSSIIPKTPQKVVGFFDVFFVVVKQQLSFVESSAFLENALISSA